MENSKNMVRGKIGEIREKICEILKNRILSNSTFGEPMVFGPVHSRRMGMSLGINNMHKKTCTYDCVYCQAGGTSMCSTCRSISVSPHELYFFVEKKLEELQKENIKIDYLSFVPNGEPTLDMNLSKEIMLLRNFGIPIAVFTNGAMLWNSRISENLLFADYVSVKVDTVNEDTWEKLNRPHMRLRYNLILDGISKFADKFQGTLVTETMLVKEINDNADEVNDIADFVNSINQTTSFFTTPTRPPSKKYAVTPSEEKLKELSGIINNKIRTAKTLFDVCCNDYITSGNIEKEIAKIMSVHPINYDSLKNLLFARGKTTAVIKEMLNRGLIKETTYNGERFFYNGNTAASFNN